MVATLVGGGEICCQGQSRAISRLAGAQGADESNSPTNRSPSSRRRERRRERKVLCHEVLSRRSRVVADRDWRERPRCSPITALPARDDQYESRFFADSGSN